MVTLSAPGPNGGFNSNAIDQNGNVVSNFWSSSFSTNAGGFIGDSGSNGDGSGAGAGSTAWGLFANSGEQSSITGDINSVIAGRDFGATGDTISIDFDNGFIDPTTAVGIRFLDPSNSVVSEFSFTGGTSDYTVSDGSGVLNTGIGFTDNGLNFALTILGPSLYQFDILAADGGSASSGPRTLSGTISQIEVFNRDAGFGSQRDLFVNNLSISVPEPTGLIAFGLYVAVTTRRMRRR